MSGENLVPMVFLFSSKVCSINLCCLIFGSKASAGIMDHDQKTSASSGLLEAYTSRVIPNGIIKACQSDIQLNMTSVTLTC